MRFFLFGFFFASALLAKGKGLQEMIEEYVGKFRAQVGVAVIIDHKDTVCVNNSADYPLMSVVKFHQAVALANQLHRKGMSMDTKIRIRKKDLKRNTYSPLRDTYPKGGVELSVRELIRYTLQLSDNNACDILFKHFGGPETTDRYIRGLGFHDFSIRYNEDDMHKDVRRCYDNKTSPLEAARLIDYIFVNEHSGQEIYEYIFQLMKNCKTGKDRLAAPLLATDAVVWHKTGTSDKNGKGQWIATNDIGYIWAPNFHTYSIAVFVKDSFEDAGTNAGIIAGVSECVWNFLCAQPPVPR